MIIKNIWNESRRYPDLDNLVLLPGESTDLSSFSVQRREACKELQNDFTKGYCICIGKSAVSSSKDTFLKDARNRALGIERRQNENEIKIPSKRKIAPPKVTALDKRTLLAESKESESEEPKQEYRKVFGPPEKITQPPNLEENRKTEDMVVVAPDGGMSVTKVPQKSLKVIDLEPFNLDSPFRYKLPKSQKSKPEEVETESIEQIVERAAQTTEQTASLICMGINRMGRPCNKRAVRGHKYCIKHMPEEERIDYQTKKRGKRFSN